MACVTGLAVDGNVSGRHTFCGDAVVATYARTDHSCMVDPIDSAPSKRRMTQLAAVSGLHVSGIPAGRRSAVMTGDAVIGHAAVIEIGTLPTHRGVAVIALIIAADMAY